MTIATWEHAKSPELNFCSKGMRAWFDGRGVDWLDFVQHGVTVEWLRAQNDAMADKLADYAERN